MLFSMKPASGYFLFGRDLLAPLPSQELPWEARDEMQRLREDEGGFWRGKYVQSTDWRSEDAPRAFKHDREDWNNIVEIRRSTGRGQM
jgi:hypothetical protein